MITILPKIGDGNFDSVSIIIIQVLYKINDYKS